MIMNGMLTYFTVRYTKYRFDFILFALPLRIYNSKMETPLCILYTKWSIYSQTNEMNRKLCYLKDIWIQMFILCCHLGFSYLRRHTTSIPYITFLCNNLRKHVRETIKNTNIGKYRTYFLFSFYGRFP